MKVGDAYGRLLREQGVEIVERDDGFITAGRLRYFAPVRVWPAVERRGLRYVRGRVLDAGAGAGRVALELQARGREVVAIDVSPGACALMRDLGVRDVRQVALEEWGEPVDTVVMYGNNLGLLASRAKARRILRRLPAERIVGTSVHVYATQEPEHLAYHERNRRRGRMPGQLRLRVRFRDVATPWFDYLLVAPEELDDLLDGTGWGVTSTIEDDGPFYVAVLDRR